MFTPRPPTVKGSMHPRFDEILTPEALTFLGRLDAAVAHGRADLLVARGDRLRRVSLGEHPDFLPETAWIRDDPSWRVATAPPALADGRGKITGPPTRNIIVDALSSGASTWTADFEDATAPSWVNIVEGQLNVYDALRGHLDVTAEDGKKHSIGASTPTVLVRPRGWRLCEKHIVADGRPLPASVVDFGLMFFHNAQWLVDQGAGPYFCLPKLESHLEARLWNDMFVTAQQLLGIPEGTIRATVLIETFTAAFEMDEILYELREHACGLDVDRWDYAFSYIKTFSGCGSTFLLPDRAQITMTSPMVRAYTELLVDTCHRRAAQPIGGLAELVQPRFREGHRPTAVTARDLMAVGQSPAVVTVAGVQTNVRVALHYLTAWVGEQGAVAIDNRMDDAATVEISRAQIWQWLRHRVRTAEGLVVTRSMVTEMVDDVVDELHAQAGDERAHRHVEEARDIFVHVTLGAELPDFFTPYAYVRYLVDRPLQPRGPITEEDLKQSMRGPFPDESASASRESPALAGAPR